MRVGLSSYALRYAVATMEHAQAAAWLLHKAADLGAEVIQYCDNAPLHSLSPGQREELRAAARERNIGVEVGTGGLDQELLVHYVTLATEFQARALRLVPYSYERELIQRQLHVLLPHLHAANMTLAVENRFGLSSVALMEVVGELDDSALGFCIDTANGTGLLERPLETVAALAPLAVQVHLKDHLVEKVPVGYHITGCPLGAGQLDIVRTLELLGTRREELDYLIEFWMDPEPTTDATLAKETDWAARSLRVARRYLGRGPASA